jgi:hypothetical protein
MSQSEVVSATHVMQNRQTDKNLKCILRIKFNEWTWWKCHVAVTVVICTLHLPVWGLNFVDFVIEVYINTSNCMVTLCAIIIHSHKSCVLPTVHFCVVSGFQCAITKVRQNHWVACVLCAVQNGTEWRVCCVLCRMGLSGVCVVCCAEWDW